MSTIVMLADVDFSRPDGTRSHVIEIARGFAAAGRAVELVARGPDPGLAGVHYHRAGGSQLGRLRRIAAMNQTALTTVLAMRGRTRALYYRFDPGLVGVIVLARLLGYRPVAEMNNVMFGADYPDREAGLAGSIIDAGKVLTLRLARLVTSDFVAVTAHIRDILTDVYGINADRVHVIPNGVDVDRFRPLDRDAAIARLGLDRTCSYVLFVGLLATWVDVKTMIEAYAAAAATRPDARLVIVGGGPEAATVERLVDSLALGDRVIRTGPVGDRDLVSTYMGAASICVVAYHGAMLERIGGGSPMKVLEYLAAGRPVVATATAGMSELLGSTGGGLAVPDTAAMAAAIGELLDDPGRAADLGRRARAAAADRYSWEPVVARVLRVVDGA